MMKKRLNFMFFRRIGFLLAIVFMIVFLSSCNEEPTFMGSTLLQDTVSIFPLSTSTTELITGASSFQHNFNIVNTGVMHIGKAGEITALSLLRFNEPIKTTDDYDFLLNYPIDKILSCKIKLFPNRYTFGDSSNPSALSFKVYRVNNYWSNLTSWDSLDANSVIDYSSAVASFTGQISQKDSMENIELDFDKEVFLNWVQNWYDYKNGDSNSIVWGLAFVPDENSTVIRQFSGTNSATSEATEMTIVYKDTAGIIDSLVIQKSIDKPIYKVPNFNPDEMIVQGSLCFRTFLYFDVSMIPPNSAIHSAHLELTLNREKSLKGNHPLDTTLLGELPSDTSLYNGDDFIRSYYAEITGDVFKFTSITSAVEMWNRGSGTGGSGKGLIVFHPDGTENERWELDKLTFYGPNEPDSTKRPVLKIIYSRIIR